MTDKVIKKIKTVDGEYQIDYNSLANLPEAGSTIEGFLPHGTIIEVPAGANLQEVFNSLEGKFCPGTVKIQLAEGVYESHGTLHLGAYNSIRNIYIIGAGVDKTIIKKTNVAADYEQTLLIGQQNAVYIQRLTVEGETTKATTGIQAIRSFLHLDNVKVKNCKQAWFAAYDNSYLEISTDVIGINEGSVKCGYGILVSNGSKAVLSQVSVSLTNATRGILSEMGAIVSIFYTQITCSGVTTKYTPALNNHSGNGWILGTEG